MAKVRKRTKAKKVPETFSARVEVLRDLMFFYANVSYKVFMSDEKNVKNKDNNLVHRVLEHILLYEGEHKKKRFTNKQNNEKFKIMSDVVSKEIGDKDIKPFSFTMALFSTLIMIIKDKAMVAEFPDGEEVFEKISSKVNVDEYLMLIKRLRNKKDVSFMEKIARKRAKEQQTQGE